jgi:hypothetical protein
MHALITSLTIYFVGVFTGTGVFSEVNCSFGASTDSIKLAPQFLQNLSSRLIFSPHFGQKFAIILFLLIDFRPYLNFSLNWHFVKQRIKRYKKSLRGRFFGRI